jgi:hypothetical protein
MSWLWLIRWAAGRETFKLEMNHIIMWLVEGGLELLQSFLYRWNSSPPSTSHMIMWFILSASSSTYWRQPPPQQHQQCSKRLMVSPGFFFFFSLFTVLNFNFNFSYGIEQSHQPPQWPLQRRPRLTHTNTTNTTLTSTDSPIWSHSDVETAMAGVAAAAGSRRDSSLVASKFFFVFFIYYTNVYFVKLWLYLRMENNNGLR